MGYCSVFIHDLNVGIPARFVYKLPQKTTHTLNSSLEGDVILYSTIPALRELLLLFLKSKWKSLQIGMDRTDIVIYNYLF